MAQMDEFTIRLLSNTEVLDINQDPLGVQASLFEGNDSKSIYVKPLEDGSLAVGLFNLSEAPLSIGFKTSALGLHSKVLIRDLWRQKDISVLELKQSWDTEVPPHGVVLLRLIPQE